MNTHRRTTLVIVLVCALSLVPPSTGSVGPVGGLTTGWIPMESSSDPAPVDGLIDGESPSKTPGIDLTDFSSVHERGVTGEDVKIGVIGSRFSADHRAIDEQVSDYRQFADDGRLLAEGGAHDTGVAEIVGRTAPNASLYLAGVGSRATPETYTAAVEWLLENDVDVVVDSASYFPPEADGMDRMNAVAANASERAVFVTSAGNYADRHWSGTLEADAATDEWVAFESDTAYNFLSDGAVSGRVSVRLYWSGEADLDLYVYRNRPGDDDPVVAKSVANQSGGGSHAESVDASLPEGHYYVAVRTTSVDGPTEMDLFAANHALAVTSSNGSMVPPATAEDVIAVGATDEWGQRRAYSSNGPLLDISAPDGTNTEAAGQLYGSSASAPVVAGTAALMISQNGNLTTEQTERILESTAFGSDEHLRLNVDGAVDAAANDPGIGPEHEGEDAVVEDEEERQQARESWNPTPAVHEPTGQPSSRGAV